jgi:MFS family permease
LVNNSILNLLGLVGTCLGGILSPFVLGFRSKKVSLRSLFGVINIVHCVFCLLKLRLNFWQIAIGRVLSGIACGVLNTLLGIFINENVPSENS